MPEFMVRKGGLEVDRVEMVSDTLTIGRDVESDIVIEDERASRVHAIARWVGGRVQLVDNGSINGTYVNGTRSAIRTLEDGDRIEIGTYALLYVEEGTAPRSRVDGAARFLNAVRKPPRDPNVTSEIALDDLPHRAERKRPAKRQPSSRDAGVVPLTPSARGKPQPARKRLPTHVTLTAVLIGIAAGAAVIVTFLFFFWLR